MKRTITILFIATALWLIPFTGTWARTGTETIRVEALIDGRSHLILRANTAQWYHLDWAAPGRHQFRNEPTIINGVEWFPEWPDIPTPENRNCYCYSDIYDCVVPPLPLGEVPITLRRIQSRHITTITQFPNGSNDYTLIIEFNDNFPPSSDWYIIEIDFPSTPSLIKVPVDIKPQSCPNPLNVKSRGVLPAAILGTADFDVTTVDLSSIRLLDVTPTRSGLEDVDTPFNPFVCKKNKFDCTDEGPDGFQDLTLKFYRQEIVQAIEDDLGRPVEDGEVIVLPLTGTLLEDFGGTPIEGKDVIFILKKGGKSHHRFE
jgi:hypothetical protein